jgi:hypothetical protein
MNGQRTLSTQYLMRNATIMLIWLPVFAFSLMLGLGFSVWQNAQYVGTWLERLVDFLFYAFALSFIGPLLGLPLSLRLNGWERKWPTEGMMAISLARPSELPSRLGEYRLTPLVSRSELGVRLTRFRLAKPLRVSVNAMFSGFWFFMFSMMFGASAAKHSAQPTNIAGALTASVVVGAATAAILLWVNRRWVCLATHAHDGTRITLTTGAWPFMRTKFRAFSRDGYLSVTNAGPIVLIKTKELELSLEKFSLGALGEWEARSVAGLVNHPHNHPA